MIVKNVSDYQTLDSQPHQYYLGRHRQQNDIHQYRQQKLKQNKNKPYFLHGLQYARSFLVQLKIKKQKENSQQLEYSPIGRKNTKVQTSHDALFNNQSYNQHNSNENKERRNQKNAKRNINKRYKQAPTQNEINQNLAEQQQSMETTKFRQNTQENNYQRQQREKQHSLCDQDKTKCLYVNQFEQSQNLSPSQLRYRKDSLKSNKNSQKIYIPSNIIKNKKKALQFRKSEDDGQQKFFKKSKNFKQDNKKEELYKKEQDRDRIQQYEVQINKVGKQLQQLYDQIQNYQIIFDNLCDCYRANQSIYNKNQRLKRQSIKLQEQKQQIIRKIQIKNKQSEQLEHLEKKVNEHIASKVQEYIRDVCQFNDDIQIVKPQSLAFNKMKLYLQDATSQIEVEDQIQYDEDNNQGSDNQRIYSQNLSLNYKKMKEKYDQRLKKKGVSDPKKNQKGVSFQEQIDVITKYYQSQMNNA